MATQWPATEIARQILLGFDDYRECFRLITEGARARSEGAHWQKAQRASAERIRLYEKKVREKLDGLLATFPRDEVQKHELTTHV